jgi:hypothetical protein
MQKIQKIIPDLGNTKKMPKNNSQSGKCKKNAKK